MSHRTSHRLRRIALMALLCLVFAFQSSTAEAQTRRGRGGTPDDIGPKNDDPTDEGRQNAKRQEKAAKLLQEGMRLLEKDDLVRAKTKLRSVVELVGSEGAGQSALAALLQLHERGMHELEEATIAFQNSEFLAALKAARRIKFVYANLLGGIPPLADKPNISQKAQALIVSITNHPDGKAALQQEKAAPIARKLARLEEQSQRDRSRLFDIYEVCRKTAKRYPDCATGKACAKRIKELKADRKAWRLIGREGDRREIASKLNEIETLEKTGKTDEARKLLERLMIRYPGKSRSELLELSKAKLK